MAIEIRQETTDSLPEYARISTAFWIRSILRVAWIDGGLGGIRLSERSVDPPYLKDYDAVGETPLTWFRLWDLSNWGIFIARENGDPVGGAAVAWRTFGFQLLEGRDDLAVLWDLRVSPDRRGHGIGELLFNQSVTWARQRQCGTLKIETQNNNVSACRFYKARGCRLGGVLPGVYDELSEEVMLLWYLDLK